MKVEIQNRVVQNITTQPFTPPPPYKILVHYFSLIREEIFNHLFQHLFLHNNSKTLEVLENCFVYCNKTIYNK